MQHNLREADFNSFIDFFFARPLPDKTKKEESWYWDSHLELSFDPPQFLKWFTKLFSEPEFLLNRYTGDQLEQGFWAMQSTLLECSLTQIIADATVELGSKIDCIRSTYLLFERLFSKDPLYTSAFMWWDSIVDSGCFPLYRQNADDGAALSDAIFETLCKILLLDSKDCQKAAIHGLGHLNHPNTKIVIEEYLESHPMLDDEMRDYALECLEGDMA